MVTEVLEGDANQNNEHFKSVGKARGLQRLSEMLQEKINEYDEKRGKEQVNDKAMVENTQDA